MKNVTRTLMLGLALLIIPALAHAQRGCEDSPEDPTIVLALVGSAGALIAMARTRYKAHKISGEKNNPE